MDYCYLGAAGIKISRLGLGGIPIQRTTAGEVASLLSASLDVGINFIDTARGYSVSEELLGEALANRRSSFVLASKSMQRTKEGMLRDIRLSLKNLKTDYLDLYQLHNIRTDAEWERVSAPNGALAALEEAQKEGLIRHIGITSHSADTLGKILESDLFVSMMLPYNAVENQTRPVFEGAHNKNIFTMAMKPLAGGFIDRIDYALRYLAADTSVDCLLVGMSSTSEIQANVRALEQGPLSAQESEELNNWVQQASKEFCRRCGYCLPCPQGIDIPVVFLLEGYYDRYELQGWAQDRYAGIATPATVCENCGQCLEKCPYNLPIPEKLARAAVKLGLKS